eukprot:6749099-Pyramimonas_sp.AAC.1
MGLASDPGIPVTQIAQVSASQLAGNWRCLTVEIYRIEPRQGRDNRMDQLERTAKNLLPSTAVNRSICPLRRATTNLQNRRGESFEGSHPSPTRTFTLFRRNLPSPLGGGDT